MMVTFLWTYHPYSLLASDNPASPAEAGHLDSRLDFSSSKKPSKSSLRSVAQRTRVHVQKNVFVRLGLTGMSSDVELGCSYLISLPIS
jgi:hypothetical protein